MVRNTPDGRHRDGNAEIYVMNADGSAQTRLTNNLASDDEPDWQPLADTAAPDLDVSFPALDGQNGWHVTSRVVGSVTADDTITGGSNITAIDCTGATVGSITGLGTPSASASPDRLGRGGQQRCLHGSLPGNAGWCRGTQTAVFSVSDATSGVASPCSGATCEFTQSTATNGGGHDRVGRSL